MATQWADGPDRIYGSGDCAARWNPERRTVPYAGGFTEGDDDEKGTDGIMELGKCVYPL